MSGEASVRSVLRVPKLRAGSSAEAYVSATGVKVNVDGGDTVPWVKVAVYVDGVAAVVMACDRAPPSDQEAKTHG